MPGARAADRLGEALGGGDRRVGVAAGPDVGDGHGVGGGEDVGEGVEQGRGPVVGQRLVDGPDAAAGLALADGGERLADRRRVVAVVVVDHDAARLALALEPAPDARRTTRGPAAIASGATPSTARGRSDAERVRRVVAARARATRSVGRPPGIEPVAPASAVRGPRPARDDGAGPVTSGRTGVRSAVPHHAPGPVGEPPDELGHPGVADVRHEHGSGGRRRVVGGGADPRLERREHRRPVGEHVGVVPLRRGQHDHVRPVRVEVAGVLVGLDDERRPGAPPRRRRHPDPRQRRRQQRPHERARVRAARRQDVDQPAGRRALAVGARDRDQRPARRRVRDDLLPRLERDARPRAPRRARGGRGRSP